MEGPQLERVHFEPLGHMALLSDARVYAELRRWLKRA